MKESYTSNPIGLRARLRGLKGLWAFHKTSAETRTRELVDLAEGYSRRAKEIFGVELSGRRILDVGPGEFLTQSRYFALQNEVVAIDADVIVEKLTVSNCLEIIRQNGMHRAVKTVARKVLGIDRAYDRALRRALGVATFPRIALHQGDVCGMQFPDETFDFIYARSVLHHIADPGVALSEIARVLKPGGVAYVDLHLYSSFNGSLDPRAVVGGNTQFFWAHLQPGTEVVDGAFLNRLRLSQWEGLFATRWARSVLSTIEVEEISVRSEADKLLAQGRLANYWREELLITTVAAIWQKEQAR